jgi:hypothetical protein
LFDYRDWGILKTWGAGILVGLGLIFYANNFRKL